MLRQPFLRAAIMAALISTTASPAFAASGIWTADASGNWSDTTKWSGGTVADASTFTADFSTINIAADRTVTLDSPRTISGLKFGDPTPDFNWTLSGGSTLTLGASPNINVVNQSTTISTVIAGTAGLTKIGAGTLTMGGATESFTGGLVVNAGTLTLDYNAGGSPSANLIGSGNALTLGGGRLNLSGNASSASSQTVNGLTLTAGGSAIVAAPASGANNPTLTLGAMSATPVAGAVVRFIGPATIDSAGSVAATATITTTTAGTGPSGAIAAFVLGQNGYFATVGLYDWAATTGSSPYTIVGGSQVSGFYQTTGVTTAGNYDVNSGGVNSIGNASGAASLRFNQNAALSINNTAFTFQNCQGILVTPRCGAFNQALTGNTLQFRRSTSSGNSYGVIWQNNTLGYLNISLALGAGRQAGQDNGLVQAGVGTVVYSGNNIYGLNTYLNGGYAVVQANNGLGAVANGSPIYLNGGTAVGKATFALDNSGANKRNINLLGNGGGLAATEGNTLTVSGVISGAAGTGPLTIGIPASSANGNTVGLLPGSGAGTANTTPVNATGTVALTGANTYTGGTIIYNTTLNFITGTLGTGGVTFNGGTLQWGGSTTTDISFQTVTINSAGATLDVNGNTVALANSIGNGGSGAVTVKSTAANGILTLSGANNYTGNTTVSSGTLKASNASGSATGAGNVTVASGATLGGAGLISGGVTLNGTLTPGASVGTLTVGSLTLGASSSCNVEFNATPANDKVVVTSSGGLTVNGGLFNLYAEGGTTPWTTLGTYNLIQYSGAFAGLDSTWTTASGTNPHIGNPQSGFTYAFGTSGGWITLTIAAGANVGTWGVDNDGNWSAAGNWTTIAGTMPPRNAGDAATLGTGSSLRTVTLDANETVGGITFNNANSFVIANSGNTLTMDNSGVGATLGVTAGTANAIQTSVALNDNTTIAVSSGNSLLVSGTVSNSPSVTKSLAVSGAGTLALSGNNSYGPSTGTVGTTLSGGGTLQVAHNSALGAGDLSVTGSSTLQAGAAGLSVANNIGLGSGVTATVDNNGNELSLGGVIGGNGSLAKTGVGTLVLGAANTYAGSTVIGAGTVSISSDSSLGTAPGAATPNRLVLNGGSLVGSSTLTLNATRGIGIGPTSGSTPGTGLLDAASGQTLTVNGLIASAGNTGANSLTLNSGAGNNGIVTLGGTNTFSGTTVISAGTLQLANSLALQNSTLNYDSGILDFGSLTAATLGGLSGSQNLALQNATPAAVALTVGGNGGSTTYSGALSGTGSSLTKSGSGTLTLTGNSSYTGITTVGAGTLQLDAGGVINGGAAGLTANGGGKLVVNGGSLTASALSTVGVTSSLIISNGSATYNAGLQNDLGTSVNNTDSIRVFGGTLSASVLTLSRTALNYGSQPSAGSTTDGLYVNGGAVNISGNLNAGTVGSANSSVNVRCDGGTTTIGGVMTVGINNVNRWSVADVNGGTLTVNNTATGISIGGPNAGPVVFLVRAGTVNAGRISFGQGTNAGNSVLNLTGGALYVGSGGMATNSLNITPVISFSAGTLGASADWSSSLPMTLGGATLQAADASAVPHNISLSGVLGGAGGLTKTGLGTLTLSGANTYTGNTTISNGTLALSGSGAIANSANIAVASGATLDVSAVTFAVSSAQTLSGGGNVLGATTINGTVAPGASIGTLNFSSDLTFSSGSTADMELGDGVAADKAAAAGAVTYAGKLKLRWTGTTLGTTYDLFDGCGFSGAFTGLELVNWPDPTKRVVLTSLSTDGTISIAANNAPTAADASLSVDKNSTNAFLLAKYASDPDGDSLSASISAAPTNGTAAVVGGTVRYTPAPGYTGSDYFVYSASDPSGLSDTGGVVVSVTGLSTNALNIVKLDVNVPGTGTNTITYAGYPNAVYDLERSDSVGAAWTNIVESTAATGVTTVEDTNAPPAGAFYRMKYKSGAP